MNTFAFVLSPTKQYKSRTCLCEVLHEWPVVATVTVANELKHGKVACDRYAITQLDGLPFRLDFLKKGGTQRHTVTYNPDKNSLECDCQDFVYRERGGDGELAAKIPACKHTAITFKILRETGVHGRADQNPAGDGRDVPGDEAPPEEAEQDSLPAVAAVRRGR